ncbi:protein Iojap-related, mitochondrial [Pyrus x bretschneideri]|uniref:protein Iojap-related, mitochondrial n=1 Tax=Pyrus x bretschneideri TaxID=225117 RepID=UPI002030A483|nr:protein Iojap-related, mitochondrial [Pyrus x bretschneideri]
MLAALRSQSLSLSFSSSLSLLRQWKLGFPAAYSTFAGKGLLDLQEVEKVLSDVKADDVKVIPAGKHCEWADFMVLATGRSMWHVKNIAQALIYKSKLKQQGGERLVLPSVEGQEGGKWIVIDSGKVIIHALDENARAYYNLEALWSSKKSEKETLEDLDKAFVKIRPKNNSKRKPTMKRA